MANSEAGEGTSNILLDPSDGSQSPVPKKKSEGESYHCCVPNCTGDSRYDSSVSFHRIPSRPSDDSLRKLWLVKIRRDIGAFFKITDKIRVCSKHFLPEEFKPSDNSGRRLSKEGSVPTIFDWTLPPKSTRKLVRVVDSFTQTDESETDEGDGIHGECRTAIIEPELSELEATRSQLLVVQAELEELRRISTTAAREADSAILQAQQELKRQKELAAQELALSRFGLERFSTNDDLIKFYTGFCSYKHLTRSYNFAKATAEKMTYCYASGVLDSRPNSRVMLLIDELFMFLVRVKLGLFEQDLAQRFNIHILSVSRKITTWANYMYFLLSSQSIWPSRDDVNANMPEEFKELYPTTKVILDCTEIFVETPSSLLLQSQLYSSYKSKTTLKGLIGIAPHGAITFISSLFTGAISDKEITRCSGIIDLLEPNDSVMADKGFDIEGMLRDRGVGLTLPPFLQSRDQFTAKQVHETKTIAKLRIHVERAIRRIKEFHIFDSPVPLSMVGTVNQIYTVVCLLTSFQGPMILKGGGSIDND